MKRSRLLIALLTVAIAGCSSARRDVPTVSMPVAPNSTASVAKASIDAQEPFVVPIIELRGDGTEIGAAHAQQLGKQIRLLFTAYFSKYFRNDEQRNMAMAAATKFSPYISAEHRAEIEAIAAGTKIDEREIMLGQCFLDLRPMTACSTIALPASASPDAVARFGRNLDFPSFNVADKASVLFIVHPKDGYAFASVAWPGMVGVLSGMNEHGLALCNMEVDRDGRKPDAMPYTLLYRTVLEKCKTVSEAVALLEKTPRQSANNLMLMDASGDRAVAEITPEAVTVRRAPETQALISTNHQRGGDLDSAARCRRFDYLHDTAAKSFGQIGRENVESMLGHVAQGKMTLQSMVFEPANRVIYLAVGANATQQPYRRLDLKPRFAK